MTLYLSLAWRNIWRNKRRSIITMASVFFAILLALFMRSATEGVYANMVRNVVGFSLGYIQIHSKGYWEERSIDNVFVENQELYKSLERKNIQNLIPRLENFALASTGNNTNVALVIGIDPDKEKVLTKINEKITKGTYLNNSSQGILIGEGMAKHLNLNLGDTLVIIGQGYHAATAAAKLPVLGIVRLGSPELDNNLIYLPLKMCQYIYSAENMLSSISVMLDDSGDLNSVKKSMTNALDTSSFEVMTWKEMMPEMDQFIEADSAGNEITIGILYLIIAFGIFGTLLMMTAERRHEFGILIAIGMKKHLLAFIVVAELILMAFIGALTGMLAGIPLIAYFYHNPIRFSGELEEVYRRFGFEPIIPMSTDASIFFTQATIVFCITLALAIYPCIAIFKLKPIEAITH